MTHGQSLAQYLAVETAGGPSWHPKKQQIVFTLNSSGVYQIFRTPIVSNVPIWPDRLTFFEDRCTNPRYLQDGSVLFTRDRGGNENFQIGHISPEGDLTWLTARPESKHRFGTFGKTKYYFQANIEDLGRLDVYEHQFPVLDTEPELIYRPEAGLVVAAALSRDERLLVMEKYLGNAEQGILFYDKDGTVTNLTEGLAGKQKNRWSVIRFLDDETLLVATDYEADIKRLALLNLNGEFTKIPTIEEKFKWEFEEGTYDSDSKYIYFFTNEDGYSKLYRGTFTPAGEAEIEALELPVKGGLEHGDARSFSRGASLSPDERYLAMTISTPTEPTNIWILDTKTGECWKATNASTAGIDPQTFADATLHRFSSFDGLDVPYFKYVPKGEKPENGWPAILMIHGGPESQTRPTFSPVLQFFVAGGFAVVTPNIRGSTGYGRKYMNLDNVEKRLDSIKDIKHLALTLKERDPDIDGERLVIYGGSYGGFAVLSAITEHPNLWRAAVDIVGISNFVTFLQNTAPWRRTLRESEYGSLAQDMDTLKKISPIHKVDRIVAPLFIIQGDNDERVPLSESLQIYEKMRERGVPVKMLRFPDEGHGLAKLKNRVKTYSEVLEWLKSIV
ncbi:MAG: prolyl oligopeptidase family serine peptidase [Candidatus Thorarchaeota archaeon]